MPNNTQISCDPDRIEAFLQQQLSIQEQSDFERHLDECEDCRERLEASAASEELWAGVRESLSSQPLSLDQNDSAVSDQTEFSYQTVLDWLAPTDDDRMLGRLDGYEVVGVVGSGGMGVVLKALDPALNRYVAIKVLAPHLGSSGAARRRFSREAQASAAVVHENVIEIHGVSEKDGLPYLVMPYVSGPSLQRRLDNEGPLELAEILRIGMQAANGLAAAHSQGLIHRDVKPANILLEQGIERVKLTDFGLARAADDASLTKSGVIAGTPQYMSPEQARGETIDQRSDLFSLGSVLYAMCAGRAPFRAETPYGMLRRITDDEPRPIREINPEIPEWLCRIIARLMSKEPEDRIQSAHDVAELLEQCLAHVQQPTAVPLPESLVPKSAGSRYFSFTRMSWTALGVLGAGVLAVLLWQSTSPPDIAGEWTGKGWGQVKLTQTGKGRYSGTYTDTYGTDDGHIELKWSRVDQRYKGTWGEGEKRFGKLSVELNEGKVWGFWTASKQSEIRPGAPDVEELLWKRASFAGDSPPPDVVPIADTTLQVLGPNGRPVADNVVIRGCEGYTGEELPSQFETPSHRGVISLRQLKPGTHWLLVRPQSILRLELPATEQRIVRALPPRNNLFAANLDGQVSVETTDDGEIIVLRIHNRDKEPVRISETDLQLMTAIKSPGADTRVFSPLWKTAAAGKQPPSTTIEPDGTATFRIDWTDWVRRGFWFSRSDEVLAEPSFPENEPGKTWVRVLPGGRPLVSVTHPDRLIAGIQNPADNPGNDPSDAARVNKLRLEYQRYIEQLNRAEQNTPADDTSSTTFTPFDCLIVDTDTRQPIPGKDFTIGLVFEIPKAENRSWQLVEDVLLGPGHPGTFRFELPEKVLKHPDRDLIRVRWFVMHRQWEQFGEYDPPRVNELINNDPRTARDGLKRIALRAIHPNSIRPEEFNELTARLYMRKRLRGGTRDQKSALYEELLKRFPNHSDRAEVMYALAGLWDVTYRADGVEPEPDRMFLWLRKTAEASRPGTKLWFESRFLLQSRLQDVRPPQFEEAEQILTEILEADPDPINEAKALNWSVDLALAENDEERGERICRQLHDRMRNEGLSKQVRREIEASAFHLLYYWFHQRDVPWAIREHKIQSFWKDYRFRHVTQTIARISRGPTGRQITVPEGIPADFEFDPTIGFDPSKLKRADPSRPAANQEIPVTPIQKGIARLVLESSQDKSRRELPAVMIPAGSQTLVVAATPATVVSDGTQSSIDRIFLHLPGKKLMEARSLPQSTNELSVYQVDYALTEVQPITPTALNVGDRLVPLSLWSIKLLDSGPDSDTRIISLDANADLDLKERRIHHHYENLIEVDQVLTEGTPVFKDGQLQGLTLLGSRFLGKAGKSYVVSVERIAELCKTIKLPSPDSSFFQLRPTLLTATQAAQQATELHGSREPVTVRCQVDAVQRQTVTDEQGRTGGQWVLLLTETPRLTVRVSPAAESVLLKQGFDIRRHFTGKVIELVGVIESNVQEVPGLPGKNWHMNLDSLDQLQYVNFDFVHYPQFPRMVSGEFTPAPRFSASQEVILSAGMRFMLDLDTGKTMDLPASPRPEQAQMDVHPDWEFNPVKGLTGMSLKGLKVQPDDRNLSPSELLFRLAREGRQPLVQMHYDEEETATYFFRTKDGTSGILELLALDSSGIRIRYKTLKTASPANQLDPENGTQPEGDLSLSFQNAPYADVIRLLGKQLDLPVQFDTTPEGTFNYKSAKKFSASEVLELLNGDLEDQDLEIVREPGRLRVRKASDSPDENTEGASDRDPRKNSLKKLPEGLTEGARYCLLRLGTPGEQFIWLIQDRDQLYVDLNGDGDLSGTEERFEEKEEQGFSIPDVTSRGFVIPPSLQNNVQLRGYFPMRISWQRSGEQYLWVRLLVADKFWQEAVISASSTQPEFAPILHFDGPLRYFLLHPISEFTLSEPFPSLSLAIGTVSETGDIAYVDLNDPPLQEKGTVIPELKAWFHATEEPEARQKIETFGLKPDEAGTYFIDTLQTTDEMQSGTIEIEVVSRKDSPLQLPPLKTRLPLIATEKGETPGEINSPE